MRRHLVKRPTPSQIRNLVAELAVAKGAEVPIRIVVEAVRRETGCSPATAYRAVADAILERKIKRVLAT